MLQHEAAGQRGLTTFVEAVCGRSEPLALQTAGGMASALGRHASGERTLTCGSNDSRKHSIHLDLDHLIRPAELCVQKVQAASMAEKGVSQRCSGESNAGLPSPSELLLREFKLDGMILDPVPLSAPSDGLPLASKRDAKRLRECRGEKRVPRPGVQKIGLEAARSYGASDANGNDWPRRVIADSRWRLLRRGKFARQKTDEPRQQAQRW